MEEIKYDSWKPNNTSSLYLCIKIYGLYPLKAKGEDQVEKLDIRLCKVFNKVISAFPTIPHLRCDGISITEFPKLVCWLENSEKYRSLNAYGYCEMQLSYDKLIRH